MRLVPRLFFLLPCLLLLACPDTRRGSGDDDDGGDDDDSGLGDDDDGTDDDDGADDDDVVNECSAPARMTNVGCIFWAVDLDNAENVVDDAAGAQFAVAVANVSDEVATVVVRINTAAVGRPSTQQLVESADVDPGEVHIFRLPRRDVDGDNITAHTDDGPQTLHSSRAFRVVSSAPIIAYQFNTLDQQFSNDASLLLPDRALGRDHLVLSYPPGAPAGFELFPGAGLAPKNRSYVTIVGTVDATEVTVTPGVNFVFGEGVPPLNAGAAGIEGRIGLREGEPRTFVLNRFDVLNLETMVALELGEIFTIGSPDPSGTRVESTESVAVFTGTDLTAVTSVDVEAGCCAEHFEQQILPTRVMRRGFVVSRSAVRNESNPENDVYRVMASQDQTTVETSLPAPNDSFTLDSGEFHEFAANRGFTVEGSGPLHVAQFLVQGTEAGSIGDSSLLYVPSVEQRQASYTFTTGEGFSENWVVISGVEGTAPQLDGADMGTSGCSGPVTDGVHGAETYVSWTCPVADGAHRVWTGAEFNAEGPPVAIFVYGYYNAGSYAYPGGSGLD